MKKKGSALVMVLTIATALLILGTAISVAVINTNKFNNRYSDSIDVELAAKSGLNIAREDLINKIKAANNAEDLPANTITAEEINFSEGEFDGINVTKEIKKNPETNNAKVYEYTIISKAKYKTEKKVEQQVITVKLTEDNGGDGGGSGSVIEVSNFINVTENVNLMWSLNSISNYINYGGNLSIENSTHSPRPDSDLKNLNLQLNNYNLNKFIKYLEGYGSYTDNTELIFTETVSSNAINSGSFTLNNLENRNIIINGDISVQHELNINLKNSNIIVNGNIQSSTGGIKINLDDNSSITTNQSISNPESNINIILNNNSSANIGGNISTENRLSITAQDNSWANIQGSISAKSGIDINMNNKSTVKIAGGLKTENVITIRTGISSWISIEENIIANSDININADNKSIVNIYGDLKTGPIITLRAGEESYINIKGSLNAGSFNISLENNSIGLIEGDIFAPSNINIDLYKSIIVSTGDLKSNNTLNEILLESVVIINGNIDINHSNTKLNNSSIICIGDFDAGYSNVFENNGKSFLLVKGNLNVKTRIDNIISTSNDFNPDCGGVIEAIKYFLTND